MNRIASQLRPAVIEEIAHWWQQCLSAAAEKDKEVKPADVGEVVAKFQSSEDEAIRGLSVGEHLHWGGNG